MQLIFVPEYKMQLNMTINFKLLTNKTPDDSGYPIVVKISQGQKRKSKEIGRAFEHDFDESTSTVLESHPFFDILAPKILQYKMIARKIIASGIENPDEAMRLLFGEQESLVLLADFGKKYVDELKAQAVAFEKIGDVKRRNNVIGTSKVFSNVIAQLELFNPKLTINQLSYTDLMQFRQQREMIGNSKATIHLYLRTLRSLYNKAIKTHHLKDNKPFDGVFKNLKTKSYDSRKKYLDEKALQKLENAQHFAESASKYVDLWLLSFYFAGADLMDIYFLKKNQIKKDRVYFFRSKTSTAVDLLISEKAQKIINKWSADDGEWLFGWRKDNDGYKGFARRMYGYLQKVQKREGIEVLPAGGNLGAKVARHSFATLAKKYNVESDLLRELMGHERDDVDNYYKDKYPAKVRDQALLKVINFCE